MKYSYIFGFVLIISCSKQNRNNQIKSHLINIDSLIISLDTREKKENFLVDLFQKDQDIRKDVESKELEILERNNYDIASSEYRNNKKRMKPVDSMNYRKALKYLRKYGYPNSQEFSSKSMYSIIAISLHQPYNNKKVLFPFLYKAYKNEDISDDDFSFLLNKMHINKYGKSYPHAITDEKNIQELLKKLELNSFFHCMKPLLLIFFIS